MRTWVVAMGGMLGSVARFWLGGAVQRINSSDFPIGTLAVNVLGSFVIGLVMAASLERGTLGPTARLFLTVGFCGGFTTMSTFSYETLMLLRDGQTAFALGNIAASVVAGLAAVWLGYTLGRIP
jgi:fluoride exporter